MPKKLFPLTLPQQRIIYTELVNPGTDFATLAFSYPLDCGEEEARAALVKALAAHPEMLLQIEAPQIGAAPEDLRQYYAELPADPLAAAEADGDAEERLSLIEAAPFKLWDSPLYEFYYLKADDKNRLVAKFHHSLVDGPGLNKFIDDFFAALAGKELSPAVCDIETLLAMERRYLDSDEAAADKNWWLENLKALPDPAELKKPAEGAPLPHAFSSFVFSEKLHSLGADFCAARGTHGRPLSPYRLGLALAVLFVSRWFRMEDVIIETAGSLRRYDKSLRGLASMLVSTLPVRVAVDKDISFSEFVERVNASLGDALEHGRYPFDKLVADLRSAGRGELPMAFAVVQNGSSGDDHGAANVPFKSDTLPLTFRVNTMLDDSDGLREMRFDYQIGQFTSEEIENMKGCFETLLLSILSNPDKKICEAEMLPPAQKRKILEEFNDTARPYDAAETVVSRFAKAAERYASEKALVYKERVMTYAELDAQSGAAARRLRALGAGTDKFVAIMLPRIPEFIIWIWGALKAGAAYVPIDPTAPAARTEYMLADSKPVALVTSPDYANIAAAYDGPIIDAFDSSFADAADETALPQPAPEDLAYLIYTSGTTGKPKGVMVKHGCLSNFCSWMEESFELRPGEGSASYPNFIFDASICDLFGPFWSGGYLAIIPTEIDLQMELVHDYIERNDAKHMTMSTQIAEQFSACRDNRTLKTLLFGGEKMRPMTPRSWKSTNGYGPTECTVASTAFQLDAKSSATSAPIGKPLANLKAYIIDGAGRLCPIGVPGELCFAGRQVARGYLNKPEATAKAFVPNPWSADEFDRTMYKTGDLCVWLPDGNISYMGRIDQQVKIRGYRIELGEIEQKLLELPEVKNAVVMAKDDSTGGKYLCAWLVSDRDIDAASISARLANLLPSYMIPAVFMQIEAVPFNTSGKVDRRALPEPEFRAAAVEYVPPVTEAQKLLAAFWRELLGAEKAGLNDDFMALGGNSLMAIRLQGRILKETGLSLQVSDLISHTKLSEMAALMEVSAGESSSFKPIPKAPDAESWPVTPAQRQMYVMQKLDETSTVYNICFASEVRGRIAPESAARAIDALVQAEPSLRTVFVERDGEVRQRVLESVPYKKIMYKVSSAKEALEKLRELDRPFDLTRAPLFRFALARVSSEHYVILGVIHHSIADGISLSIIGRRFWEFVDGAACAVPQTDYKDYACWRAEEEKGEEYAAKERWWLSQFEDGIPSLDLITDFPRPSKLGDGGATIKASLPSALLRSLSALASECKATDFPAMLAIWAAVLGRCARAEDVVVGVPFSGREHPDTADMVGMFVSTLPLRIRPSGEKSFRQLLKELSLLVEEARKRQDYPFERLVEKLGVERQPSRNPIFDVLFNLSPLAPHKPRAGVEIRDLDTEGADQAHFDMTMRILRGENSCEACINYRTELYSRETAQAMLESFVTLLEHACAEPDAKLSSLSMLSEEREAEVIRLSAGERLSIPEEATFPALFSETVKRVPDKTAVGDLHTAYTYRALEEKSGALAASLTEAGAGHGSIAAILLPRRAEITLAILGIMKAGAAYLPIDLAYPAERIEYMLEDSGAGFVIGCDKTRAMLPASFKGEFVDIYDERLYEDRAPQACVSKPEDLAYIIYTSGSTGKPKGVMIEQRALVNHLLWAAAAVGLTENDAGAVHASFSFDSSVKQLMAPLTVGAATWIISEEMRLDIDALNAYFKEKHITAAYLPTKFAELFFESEENDGLRFIMYGGEKATSWKKTPYKLINCYGPTEFTVNAVTGEIKGPSANIPIGRPVANSFGYITDQYGGLQPAGLPGELCMAGPQIARGYLNRPELTEKVFIKNPFGHGRIYRTGDLCRWTADGEMEYLGRIDKQVKIRGFRIELGEIEENISRACGVTACAVVNLTDPSGADCLAAYIVGDGADSASIEAKLRRSLPAYMIPSYWVKLERLPLNASGKLDRNALPIPWKGAPAEAGVKVKPRTEKEAAIAELWSEATGVADPGVTDNFFASGGTSLKAIHLVSLMQRRYELSIATLFENQTIEKLAASVKESADNISAKLDGVRRKLRATAPELDEAELERKRAYEQAAQNEDMSRYDERIEYASLLITGATGYLGSYLLRELALNGTAKLTALVRAADDDSARLRLEERLSLYFGEEAAEIMKRVRVVAGDLEKEALGLSKALYSSLADEADAVINTAANVRHYGLYEEFYKSNVETVKRLIAFAESGKKKELLHVSTLSVAAGAHGGKKAVFFSEDDCDREQDSGNVYVKTKLEAEKELLKSAEGGLRAIVVRVGNIAYCSSNGRHQANLDENGFYTRMKSLLNMGMVPEKGLEFELSYVDRLARAVALLVGRPALWGETMHLSNGDRHEMAEVLKSPELGLCVEAMSQEHFFERAAALYGKKGFGRFVEELFTHLGWFDSSAGAAARVELSSLRSDRIMEHLGFCWGAIDLRLMNTMVRSALEERRSAMACNRIFAALSSDSAESAARMARLRLFAPDDFIEIEEKEADRVFLLLDGCAEESRNSEYGWACTISLQKDGDLLGYEGLLSRGGLTVTTQAILDDALALEFKSEELRKLIESEPKAAAALGEALMKKWNTSTFMLVNAG